MKMGQRKALGMSSFHSFIWSLNIYEYLLCARSMIGLMNKTESLPSWVVITLLLRSDPLVLLMVWGIWLGFSDQSPKLLKVIKMVEVEGRGESCSWTKLLWRVSLLSPYPFPSWLPAELSQWVSKCDFFYWQHMIPFQVFMIILESDRD